MSALDWVFDAVLALAILILAARALAGPDLFRAVVLFIACGLLVAVAWVRLDAPDLALAEAAIGAGLTGALLLTALGSLRQPRASFRGTREGAAQTASVPALPNRAPRYFAALLCLLLFALIALAFADLPASGGLAAAVAERLDESGVAHPVTAVLLNFRAWDTLLELVVLWLALLAARALPAVPPSRETPVPVMLAGLARLAAPVMLLAAGYLLWRGAFAPGGAFQAGAMLAATGVLLVLSGHPLERRLRDVWRRPLVAAGLAVFLAVALAPMIAGHALLTLPQPWAGLLILVVEIAAAISIGVTLTALYLACGAQERTR